MECAVHALGHGDAACVNRTEVSTIGADRIGPFDVEGALAQARRSFSARWGVASHVGRPASPARILLV